VDDVGMDGDVGIGNGAVAPVSASLESGFGGERRGGVDLEAGRIEPAAAVSVAVTAAAVAVAAIESVADPAAPDAT